MLHINEIFDTVQGEAFYTGTPATFIRLQGCPVGCHWCDTKHTWHKGLESKKISAEQMLLKTVDSPSWAAVTEDEICEMVSKLKPRHFVLTGGEPCAQSIYSLTEKLLHIGSVQVETSGTHGINVHYETWVTVSPKVDMKGGLHVLDTSLLRANEIKMPIDGLKDVNNLKKLVNRVDFTGYVWLQPVSQGVENTDLCVKTATDMNWKISIQTHKYMGVR